MRIKKIQYKIFKESSQIQKKWLRLYNEANDMDVYDRDLYYRLTSYNNKLLFLYIDMRLFAKILIDDL